MPMLADRLKEQQKGRDKPLWEGPSSDGPNGGITQSMMNNFLVCRERFRIKYVLGLQTADTFNSRLEYGSMWHMAEESLAAKDEDPWLKLDTYTLELCQRYPLQQADVIHWHNIVKLEFPIYREYWAKHEDVQGRTPLLQEEVFNIPYKLPSGRTVRLRGKFDSVDLIDDGIWLQENKTKGDIDSQLLQRQLTFDLQTGVYLVALSWANYHDEDGNGLPAPELRFGKEIAGVRYNVIRRPLAGGKGSIRQKKNQSQEEFYEELGGIIKSATGPEWGVLPDEHFFFMRWKVGITTQDIETYQHQFLRPTLNTVSHWYDHVTECGPDPFANCGKPEHAGIHFRAPYGIYSPLYDGKPTDVDSYLETGSTVGLKRVEFLFKELK